MDTPRLLIADSHRVGTEDLALCLRHLGYEIAGTASTGVEAVAEAQKKRPDLVMVDLNVQGHIDARTAARNIGIGLGIPVVYVAGPDSGHLLAGSFDTGSYGYLFKPFTVQHLQTVIESALSNSGKHKRLRETAGLYQALLRMAPTPLVLRSDTRILLANAAARHCPELNVSSGVIGVANSTEPLRSKDPPDQATPEPVGRQTVTVLTTEGKEAVLELAHTTAVLDGESVHLIAGRDVSEQRRAEETLRRAEALLAALNDAHRRCIQAHDMPLLLQGLLKGLATLTRSSWGWMAEVVYDEKGTPYPGTSAWEGTGTAGQDALQPDARDDINPPWSEMEQHIALTIATEEAFFLRPETPGEQSPEHRAIPARRPRAAVLPLHSGNKFVAVAALGDGPMEYEEQDLKLIQPYLQLCAFMMEAHSYHERHKEQDRARQVKEERFESRSHPDGLISMARW